MMIPLHVPRRCLALLWVPFFCFLVTLGFARGQTRA